MEKPANIRLATIEDAPALFFALMAEQETDWPMGLPVSPRSVSNVVLGACRGENSCAGIIDGPNGTILGSVCIRAEVPWFSEITILGTVWIFTHPSARRGGELRDDLFQFARWHQADMSKRVGYPLTMENMVLSYTRLPAKLRIWQKYGDMVGGVFWARGAEDVREEQRDDADDRADESSGQPSLSGSAEPGQAADEQAPRALQRPSRRAVERLTESSDQPDSGVRKPRAALFD